MEKRNEGEQSMKDDAKQKSVAKTLSYRYHEHALNV